MRKIYHGQNRDRLATYTGSLIIGAGLIGAGYAITQLFGGDGGLEQTLNDPCFADEVSTVQIEAVDSTTLDRDVLFYVGQDNQLNSIHFENDYDISLDDRVSYVGNTCSGHDYFVRKE